jgi:hypothetical protein
MAMLWKLPVAFIVEKQWLRDGNSVERTAANRYRYMEIRFRLSDQLMGMNP